MVVQLRCKNARLCTKLGTKVIVTDLNKNNQTDFVLSSRAFMGMANKGMGQDILKLGIVDVEYKRLAHIHKFICIFGIGNPIVRYLHECTTYLCILDFFCGFNRVSTNWRWHWSIAWNRVPCDYKNQNLAVRVEEMSKKPNYLAVKFLYQGGQTEIVGVDVAKVNSKVTIVAIISGNSFDFLEFISREMFFLVLLIY